MNGGIQRPSLTSALGDEIRARIIRGSLSADRPLVEAELAGELGVSRTPLREALVALEREGFVTRIPNRGFFVVPLSVAEARETYPLVGALEALALRTQGPVGGATLARLKADNRELLSLLGAPDALLRRDAAWHDLLLAGCDNRKLMHLLGVLKGQLLRYEYAFMAEAGSLANSARDHSGIIEALERGEIERAAGRLEEHWRAGAPAIAAWLGHREERS